MAARRVERTSKFISCVKQLSKKHPKLTDAIDKTLRAFASANTPPGDKIPNLKGQPVFKKRIPLGRDQGQQGGGRIIYYCDDNRVLALFLYGKGDQTNKPPKEILEALKKYGLLDAPDAPRK